MNPMQSYEAVIGLEVHAELSTNTKIFCGCPTTFGAAPNTQVCPICLGYPGTMPRLNRRAVELAILAGLALNCRISNRFHTDRKQYFYPDLPKGYQISQDDEPICRDGYLDVVSEGKHLRVPITRIHFEEDAGKLIHEGERTLIDFNRAGVALIEIVSAPALHTPREAADYVRALRAVLLAAGVSDCKMQEGSLRCDVNVSIRKRGSDAMGVRTEIKNLNSFAFIEKAIQYELTRQSEQLSHGETLVSETRRFDPATGKTYPMRTKERAIDYRFLPEPDLPPIAVSECEIERIRKTLPELPAARAERLVTSFGMTPADAAILSSDASLGDYFEQTAASTEAPLVALHLILGELLRQSRGESFSTALLPQHLATIADLAHTGRINSSTAKRLLSRTFDADADVAAIVRAEGLEQIRDEATLAALIDETLKSDPRSVNDYKNGKTAALRALQGRAMKASGGRADPVLLEQMLKRALDS